jgi:tetratricopeptide (TPR) repeat protein/predicted aspartyl protease
MHATHEGPFARPIVIAASALLALALLAPAASRADCHMKVAEMPVYMVGSRVMTSLGINGQDVPMMVDSGAFYSFLSDGAAAQLALPTRSAHDLEVNGLTGRVKVRIATVERLKLLKGTLPNVEFLVGGNESGSESMGLIGRNLLNFADTEYDLAHGMIRLVVPNGDCEKENMAYWADSGTVVSVADLLHTPRADFNAQPLRAEVKINGKTFTALFDTGATTAVSLSAAKSAGVQEADMTPDHDMYGAGKHTARAWTASFATFELGGETITHNRIEVGDFELQDDMLLGVDFFLSHHIYVSAQQKRMYFTYNGGPVFKLNKATHASAMPAAASGALDLDATLRRGAASLARGDLGGALADFDRACALAPQDAAGFAGRGEVYRALKQPADALQDFDTTLRLDPRQARPRLARARMRVDAGDAPGALADVAELDKTVAPQAEMRLSMARLYAELGQPAHAVPQLDQWILAHPHEIRLPEAYNERCWARVLLGTDLVQALADCDAAIDLDDKKNASHFDNRGWVRLRLGQWPQASDDFDRALKVDRETPSSLYGRSIAQSRLGDLRASQSDLEAARKLRPTIVEDLHKQGLSQGQLPVNP